MSEFYHIPVMPAEVVSFLDPQPGKIYVDCTVGGGGHSQLIASHGGEIIGIDRDQEALTAARLKLPQAKLIHGNFRFLKDLVDQPVDGILIDLGVSSHQLDKSERGFSFNNEESDLDMRMDRSQRLTAADILNSYSEEELSNIIFRYGEERYARRIARKIVEIRPLYKCKDLLEVIRRATPPKYRFSRRRHYASKVFRALRMAVNDELVVVEEVIPQAINLLKPSARLVIIAFNSLEDRIVKHTLRASPEVKVLTKKVCRPTEEEVKRNLRSASALLRAAEKLDPSEAIGIMK